MVSWNGTSRWLACLVLGLLPAGCTRPFARPFTRPPQKPTVAIQPHQEADVRFEPEDPDEPPIPAPALYIPGPPRALPMPQKSMANVETLPLTLVSAQEQAPEQVPDAAALPPLVAAQAPEEAPVSPLRDIHQKAARKHATIDSYIVRLRRREVVNGEHRPEEIMLMKFRKEPWSVYFKWLGNEGKGREVVYVKGRHGNQIHTLTAAGDIPLIPAGRRIKVAPDGILVKSKSRHPITDAGLGSLIESFGRLVAATEQGNPREGTAKYLGQLKRPEFDQKVEAILQSIPAKSEPLLPRGGQRLWFFDPELHLPLLVITQDETGREVEYYCHDRFQFPVRLDDADFDPDVLWKQAS